MVRYTTTLFLFNFLNIFAKKEKRNTLNMLSKFYILKSANPIGNIPTFNRKWTAIS